MSHNLPARTWRHLQHLAGETFHTPSNTFYHLCDANGDQSGATNLNPAGATAESPVVYYYQVPAGHVAFVHRAILHIEDSAIVADKYGSVGVGTLANGVMMGATKDGPYTATMADALHLFGFSKDPTGIFTFNDSIGLGKAAYDVDRKAYGGGNEFMLGRFTFDSALGTPIMLVDGDCFNFVAQDDLSGLVDHSLTVMGELHKLPTRAAS